MRSATILIVRPVSIFGEVSSIVVKEIVAIPSVSKFFPFAEQISKRFSIGLKPFPEELVKEIGVRGGRSDGRNPRLLRAFREASLKVIPMPWPSSG